MVEGKMISRTEDNLDDLLIGEHASAEAPEGKGTDSTVSTGVDIIMNHHMQEISFTKETYKKYIKLWPVCSVVRVSAGVQKGLQLDSRSRSYTRFAGLILALIRACAGGNQLMCLSHICFSLCVFLSSSFFSSSFLPSSVSKNQWKKISSGKDEQQQKRSTFKIT
uniref:Translationally-controlled tumor protein n=1 Tax=Molossus molossus TaxID=27622 RepID=A0A7J8HHR5_MOLMO|nr:hypothetical protein HJG59_010989 [Molossus molossus]